MQIKELFKKDISRNIQGVVKVGQDSKEVIIDELEEYVVTKELNRHFDRFFENYRKGTTVRTEKIGVWISGFFGSGKSHFLKILSYILSNKSYDGMRAIDFFDDKILDSRILADMKVAAETSADVILFNIDSKSDSDSKVNKDAIVKVFMKVFNEMQGFCCSMPWVADLERLMTRDNTYEDYKNKFKEISGKAWEQAREDFYFEDDNIIKALAETTKMSIEGARSWYDKAEKDYSLDIDSFAKRVSEYIETKSKKLGKKHHVIFLCDEIGQYIGSDDNLMLNLQTVVEDLGRECGGRAWVIVTSQLDIDSITRVNRDNFSKIIGRFDTKLALSGANVDEVVKKRLLAKTDTARDKLKLIYADKNAVIKNLITFSPDTSEKKLFKNEDDFVDIYPFIPYQFNLLQAVFTGIRTHGASGKHLAEGERSLLNAFQEAAIQFSSEDDTILIPFDVFYNSIETFLDHNIRTVIIQSETNENLQPTDVDVLKVLFMIKYIANVLPANLENIATIMIRKIDQDKIETKKTIDASLRRLEKEKLIIKNGDQFIFLTNEEQDINREIREIKIDASEIIEKIGEEVFANLFGLNRKYRYSDKYDFGFNSIIDDRARGAQKEEIGIKIITPMYLHSADLTEQELKSISLRERNVIMILPQDMGFIDEMEQALQIDAFVRRNSGRTSTEVVEDIKTTKIRESKQRKDRCKDQINEALKRADIYVNHNKLDIKDKLPSERANDAFKVLVESIYTKQNYIKKSFLTNDDLKEILSENESQIVLDGVVSNEPNLLAIEEVIDFITKSSYKNIQTTAKIIMEYFNKIPYGWREMDIAGILLSIFKTQEIKLELGGESINTNDYNAINYLTKKDYLDRLIIKMRVKISAPLLVNAKKLAKDVFGKSDMPNDEDGLMVRIRELATNELYQMDGNIKDLLSLYTVNSYPGKKILEDGKKIFEDLLKIKDAKGFFDFLENGKEAMLDYEESAQDVKKFFKNQKEIFDKTLSMLAIYENNRSYVLDKETINTVFEMEKIKNAASPYSDIQKLPELNNKFMDRFVDLLNSECEPIKIDIQKDLNDVLEEIDSRKIEDNFRNKAESDFKALLERLEKANNIYEAIAMRTESDRLKQRIIAEIIASLPDDTDEPRPKVKTLSLRSLIESNSQFSSKNEIEKLLSDLRIKLEAELEENTTVKII